MSAILPPRRLIPRWRRTSSTLEMAEASFSGRKSCSLIEIDAGEFPDSVKKWRETPTAGHLGDVLAFSVIPQLREQIEAIAREVITKSAQATPTQMALISSVLGLQETDLSEQEMMAVCNPATQQEIRLLRQMLWINPANPLALLDVAQFQLASGKRKQAERSLISALSLSPNNRLVLRTVSRFYVHTGDPERAHQLVRKHPMTLQDPWLMASEVALAELAETAPRCASRGFKFVRDKSADYPDVSELAGALGGIELASGGTRKARELFRIALRSPNDNVIAQAITNQTALGLNLRLPMQTRLSLSASEARVLLAWESLDTALAEHHAIAWHLEEPFSSRPLHFLTTLYAIQGRYGEGANLIRRGLIADPGDPTLLANLAYIFASSGQLNESEIVLRRLAKQGAGGRFNGMILATNGLIAMKRGSYELGDQLYLEAINRFRRQGDPTLTSTCFAYYARSAMDTSHPRKNAIIATAVEEYSSAKCADAAVVLRGLNQDVELAEKSRSARQISQWIFDERDNTLTQRHRITKPGESNLVIYKKQ